MSKKYKVQCDCGATVYNTNAMGWRLVSQLLIRKCNNGDLPEEFQSNAHFYYARSSTSMTNCRRAE